MLSICLNIENRNISASQEYSGESVCVAVKMIRRGGGRAPPVILIGLLVMLAILGFNYWLLSSQNADLQQELEKLQAEVKIRYVRGRPVTRWLSGRHWLIDELWW